jgi:predicted nucleotide-binding protein (sugar kinase/HSP70/actin superfamily)
VAQSILPKVSRELQIPVISFIIDEHTGTAGLLTRLEAFVDLMERRRSATHPGRPRRAAPTGADAGGGD